MTTPSPAMVVGLDLSLTSTGIAHVDGRVETFKPDDDGVHNLGLDRLLEVRDHVAACVPPDTELVMIEGLAYSAHDRDKQLAQLAGIVRAELYERGDALMVIPPGSIKKYATGKGGCAKEAVLGAAIRRLGYEGDSLDEADALWLRAFGCALVGVPIAQVPLVHQEALLPWMKTIPIRHPKHRRL